MTEKQCPVSAEESRDYLAAVTQSGLGKSVLTAMGYGLVVASPGEGSDEQTVKLAVKLSLAIYRQFKPRLRRGFSWGPGSDDNSGGDRPAGAAVGVGKGGRKGR